MLSPDSQSTASIKVSWLSPGLIIVTKVLMSVVQRVVSVPQTQSGFQIHSREVGGSCHSHARLSLVCAGRGHQDNPQQNVHHLGMG